VFKDVLFWTLELPIPVLPWKRLLFSMETMDSKAKATGAGSSNMDTLLSKDNVIAINTWQVSQWELIVLDLSHVNDALPVFETKKVQGILGADLLSEGAAVIDYAKKWLYLKG
jgi:hypothetical protein